MVKPYRLPAGVRPVHYELHLRPRLGEPTFSGEARIQLLIERATQSIDLHARDITVHSAQLVGHGPAEVAPDPDAERLVLRLARPVPPGEATLALRFTGQVSRSMEGLYLSKDGAEECLATQCEETDARAIFPCFDEPAFKARYSLSVTTDAGMTVLANAPLLSRDEEGAQATWRFATTRPMSSYLFALAVGRFASTPTRTERGAPMRVLALEGKEALGAYGLDFAARLLPWFEDYFGARYHFDKYDQVAVPSFSAGAMENAGLVIFRQTLLLHDPRTTSWSQEKLIARIIAHEFAHQWFGNLVTMAWWDDIWLNESFAEWMAHKAADAVAPEYGLWSDFDENKREALVTDALASTHAIYSPVETPEQATELFDTVTYSKGSVLMRMIERALGEDAFRAGLRTYMREFAERNAKGDDLWRHLAEASRQDVTRLARSWILQPGYPVVSARLEGATLRLLQRRFYAKPGAPESEQTWTIPLVVRHADDAGVHETRHLLDARDGEMRLAIHGSLRWVHLNADGVGFYRQHLDAHLRSLLARSVDELTAAEQRDLLDDARALARAGQQPISAFLDLVGPVVRAAKDHHVVAHAVGSLEELEDVLLETGDEASLGRMRAWARALLAGEWERLGPAPRPDEPRDDRERRPHVLRAMARLARDESARRAAVAIAEREAQDPASADPALAGPAVHLAARFGDGARHARHLEVYEARRASGMSPALAQRYLYSLVLFEDPPLLARTTRLMAEGRFPLEALGPMLRLMLSERHARLAGWEHLTTHWKVVRERLGDMWTSFLVEHAGNLPASMRGDVVRFFDANLHGVAQQSYARAIEAMDARAEFEQRAGPELAAWLQRAAGQKT